MDAFETSLKRAFAEAHEPADAGFSERVSRTLARAERAAGFQAMVQRVGLIAAGAAVAYGAITMAQGMAPQLMASFGLEIARAHGALSTAGLGIGLTQIFIVAACLAGGAVAYRSTQE